MPFGAADGPPQSRQKRRVEKLPDAGRDTLLRDPAWHVQEAENSRTPESRGTITRDEEGSEK